MGGGKYYHHLEEGGHGFPLLVLAVAGDPLDYQVGASTYPPG